jgi:hypothetical protein
MKTTDLLNSWQKIPHDIEALTAGRSDDEMAYRPKK